MSVDDNLLEWGFKGSVSVVLTIGGWLWIMLIRAVSKNKEDLAEHKLHVATNYATKVDVNATMIDIKDTVKRVHERIDGIYEILNTGKSHDR